MGIQQKYRDELRNKKRKKFLTNVGLFFIAGLAAVIGLAYLLFFTHILDVRIVNIEADNDQLTDINDTVNDWLNEGFWQFTRRNNILFFSSDELVSKLTSRFPTLADIEISKKPPHAISIFADERKAVGVLCSSAQAGLSDGEPCFYFDKNGIAFSRARPSSGFLIFNIVDHRSRELRLGESVLAGDWLLSITGAREALLKKSINVSEFVIPVDSFDEFYAKTAEGWKIEFNISTDIVKQINALSVFLKEKISPAQRAMLQYVDLRIQDRIYYK